MELKGLLTEWQLGMQEADAWNALFWNNHDQPRALSRFGDDKNYPLESAKMLATTIHCLRGTPYIYQGEEIGMTNAYFEDINQYKDVESLNYFNILKEKGFSEPEVYRILQERSRDNARTPMQWDATAHAGFTTGTPWIEVISNYAEINAAVAMKTENSIFSHYQRLIRLRKEYAVIAEGQFKALLPEHPAVFAYERHLADESLIVLNNFYGTDTTVALDLEPAGYVCLLSNYPQQELNAQMSLKPYESMVYYKKC
jgi:trehalose-6-phosphate hydrolase